MIGLAAGLILLPGCGSEGEGESAAARAQQETRSGTGEDQTLPRGPRPLAGAERVVFIGDSLAAEGAPTYAALLPQALDSDLRVENMAQAGARSSDWLPGRPLFNDLRGRVEGADVVFVTVGGNDLQDAFGASDGPDALGAARDSSQLERVSAAFDRIERNLGRTFEAIRRADPDVAIAWVGYPDYSGATVWQERTDTLGLLALRTGLERLDSAASEAGADHVLGMLDATARVGPDALLAGAEHLGPEGHQLYARRIAGRLGPG